MAQSVTVAQYPIPNRFWVRGGELIWSDEDITQVPTVERVLDELVALTRDPHSPNTRESMVLRFASRYGPWSRCGPHHVHGFLRPDMPPVRIRELSAQEVTATAEAGPSSLRAVSDREDFDLLVGNAATVNGVRAVLARLRRDLEPAADDWDLAFPPTRRYVLDADGVGRRPEDRRHPLPTDAVAGLREVGELIAEWLAHFHVALRLDPYEPRRRTRDLHRPRFAYRQTVPLGGLGAAVAHGLVIEASTDTDIGRCEACGVTWRARRGVPGHKCQWCLASARQRRRREKGGEYA